MRPDRAIGQDAAVVMIADLDSCIWVMGNVHLDLAFRPCNGSRHCSCNDSQFGLLYFVHVKCGVRPWVLTVQSVQTLQL